ncbi:MAG: recombinase family protein, partial [Acidobacteriota bacterium]
MSSVAVLYRVSTKKQAKRQRRLLESDESLPVQAAVVKEFITRQADWTVVKEYTEELSAFKFSKDDRDIIQQVIRDAMNGVFDILLVFKSDRLSRRAFEYPMILWTLQQSGVTVISVADGGKVLNMKDQPEKLMRFVEGWQSETESVNTSIRVKEVMQRLAEKGIWSGGRPPYGYKLSERKTGPALEIYEPEAAVIREMVRLYLEENLGSKRIATALNEKGIYTR